MRLHIYIKKWNRLLYTDQVPFYLPIQVCWWINKNKESQNFHCEHMCVCACVCLSKMDPINSCRPSCMAFEIKLNGSANDQRSEAALSLQLYTYICCWPDDKRHHFKQNSTNCLHNYIYSVMISYISFGEKKSSQPDVATGLCTNWIYLLFK